MKNKNIEYFLKINFFWFSLLIVLISIIAVSFINIMGDKYLLTEAKNYFAETLIDKDYKNIKTDQLNKIGGWITILDENLNVIFSSNPSEIKSYTKHQLIDLSNGQLLYHNKKMYGSMKYFHDKSDNELLGIVCIPAEYINQTTTINNTTSGATKILLIFLIGIIFIIIGYILTIYMLSKNMKKKLTNPIHLLMNAFNKIMDGNYQTKLDYYSVSEFNEIKNSFNDMVEKLYNIENDKKNLYQQRQQMLMDISHDLKTPITIIHGYSTLALDPMISDDKKEKSLEIIKNHSKNMSELIDILLDYARFDYTDYKIEFKKIDLSEFLRKITIEKITFFEEKNITTEVKIPDKKIFSEIDDKIFKRAIINLLNNIPQHNPSGINVLIKLTEDKKIIIADNGNYISEDIKNKIFEPFVCGDKARQINKHNNGLGLSITKKIIEQHKGTLKLEQPYNNYTKAFIIEIP